MEEQRARKDAMRKDCLARRDSLSPEERAQKSLAIAASGTAALAGDVAGRIVAGYFPIRSEVDVRPLLETLEDVGAKIALPVVLDRETIIFRHHRTGNMLVAGGFGTMAPGGDAETVDPDILLMPLAGFDLSGNRIGYGAGHYDRAIARLIAANHRPMMIGIAFDLQEVPFVAAEAHDVPLDAVLTESGFRRCGA
ncbi:5-formyltetrahydrofolate cyclo-ligase [Martelella alba]